MGHIELARWADVLVIAPASANMIAKLSHGLADDLLSTLALVTEAPVIVCPAMNHSMYAHAATQENLKTLETRGVRILGPDSGSQACGEEGYGRLVEAKAILDAIRLAHLGPCLHNQRVLITGGPTREAIDPVRYLSNYSSGKMAYALAQAAAFAGAEVILISGPTNLSSPTGVRCIKIDSAAEMLLAVEAELTEGTVFIAAAAVADYHIETIAVQKIKKQKDQDLLLKLKTNPDILATVAASGKSSFVVGFAAETTDVIAHATQKLDQKKLDMIIANEVGSGLGFNQANNKVTIITKEGHQTLPLAHKTFLAGQIIAIIARALHNVAH